ncbi:MAG: hypothetical protein K6A96_02240 [Prevotella sp.]|jgi:hypothetical protein|nr:hypothetical protein [Prevotella sp.]
MARRPDWHDDYWLLVMQAYLHRPVGIKPMYSRIMVDLSMELHIPPQTLRNRMQQLARLDTPRIERIWNTYSSDRKRLTRAVQLLRDMKGFGAAEDFYEGVEVQESFERDFRPLDEDERFTPVMLILILNLYFQLTPITMVSGTPEVAELARLLKIKAKDVVEVLDVFQICDPYLERNEVTLSPLLLPCQRVWQRMSDKEPHQLDAFAEELKEYYR